VSKSILRVKSYNFALRVVKLYRYLSNEKREYVLSKQVLRSGTGIGALIREAEFSQSKADFIHKMSIALKEANESDYWFSLLKDSNYITLDMYNSIQPEVEELISMLVSSIKTAKRNSKNEKEKE